MSEKEDKSWAAARDLRGDTQNDEREARRGAIEEAHFNADPFGHWEDYATRRFNGKPRYQIDLVKPIIDSIAGEIEQMELGGQVIPVGGDATVDLANTYERILRTISNISDAPDIYSDAARNIVDHAYDAWMVMTDWADVDSFDQDIVIKRIPDAITRVWVPGMSTATGPEDNKAGFIDTELPLSEYNKMFPDGNGVSLSNFGFNYKENRVRDTETEGVIVSDYYYIKEETALLHLLSDNRVVTNDDYEPVAEELKAKGITSLRQKARRLPVCYMRKMDGSGWISEEQKTVFRYIPVIQALANFQILNGNPYYRGETRKLMDPQRIYDYGTSKDVLDGALGRKSKIVITTDQAEGHEDQNRKLNTEDDPLFIHTHAEGQTPPYALPGTQLDAQLANTLTRTQADMKEISMSHNPQQGAGLAGHSGKAYEILTEKSNTASHKYIKQIERCVAWTNKIIVDAIPRVIDTKNRQIRLTNEDGTSTFETVNKEIMTEDGLQVINDLAQGSYMFKVTSGPAYSNRRAEGVQAVKEWAALDPSIIDEGADIIYKALNAPGTNEIADRVRKRKIEEGRVPVDQLTEEEKEKLAQEIEARSQQDQPDPLDQATSQAIMAEVQNIASQIEERQVKMELALAESERKVAEMEIRRG